MKKETKQVLGVVGAFTGIGTLIHLLTRAKAAPPPPPPPGEPAIEVDRETAYWDKDTYEPGEFAILTVTVRNPTSMALTYDAVARHIRNSTWTIRFENSFTLAAGEEREITFAGNAPSEGGAYLIVIDVYCGEEYIYSGKVPDLVVSPPAVGVQFIMLGGIHKSRVWHLDEDVYTMYGTLKNVGDETGTTTVVGWFKVGNYGDINDIYQETITLGPGQTRDISFAISRAEMEAAELEAGYSPDARYFEWLYACISTRGHVAHGTIYGWLAASDIVYIETEAW